MQKFYLATFSILLVLSACNKSDLLVKKFPYQGFYVTGTIQGNKSPERKSPFAVQFKDSMKASYIQVTKEFPANYSLSDDTIIVKTNDNEKITKLLVKNDQIIFCSYVALANEAKPNTNFTCEAFLGKIPSDNQFAGKTFNGNLYKLGLKDIFKENYFLMFDKSGINISEGEGMNRVQYDLKIYDNVSFRYQQGSTKFMGSIVNDSLIYFKESGLYYWGSFKS